MTDFTPTHRITTPSTAFVVELIDGAAYTRQEMASASTADWEFSVSGLLCQGRVVDGASIAPLHPGEWEVIESVRLAAQASSAAWDDYNSDHSDHERGEAADAASDAVEALLAGELERAMDCARAACAWESECPGGASPAYDGFSRAVHEAREAILGLRLAAQQEGADSDADDLTALRTGRGWCYVEGDPTDGYHYPRWWPTETATELEDLEAAYQRGAGRWHD